LGSALAQSLTLRSRSIFRNRRLTSFATGMWFCPRQFVLGDRDTLPRQGRFT
jgi:hypothetical protein